MTLSVFTLANRFGQLTAAEYGGQLLRWKSADGVENLYTPEHASIQPGRALRGGIPICFPQFSGRGNLPKHGLVRTRPWQLRAQTETAMTLAISDDAGTRALWPYSFELIQTLTLDVRGLVIALDVHNRTDAPMAFTAALHSYIRVPNVLTCSLGGLNGREYEDAADNGRYKTETGDLRIQGEVDRVFTDSPKSLVLRRGGLADLHISQGGFADTVVWCPGPALAATFTDMPAEDWRCMLCVEAAAAAQPVTLAAGGRWQGWQRLHAG